MTISIFKETAVATSPQKAEKFAADSECVLGSHETEDEVVCKIKSPMGKKPAFSWFLALGAILVTLICFVFGLASVVATALGIGTEVEGFHYPVPSDPLFKLTALGLAFLVCIFFACLKIAKKAECISEKRFVRALAVVAFAFCLWWIFVNGTETNGFSDLRQLLAYAQQLAAGDYSSFLPHSESFANKLPGDMYLSNYPFQSGILLLMEGFVRLFGGHAVPAFQIANAAAAVSSALVLVRMTRILKRPKAERLICAFLALTFMPSLVFVIFPYGNAIGFALALLSIELWMRSRMQSKHRELCMLAAAFLLLTLGLMVKSTYLVAAIGALIVLLIDCVRRRTPLSAVLLVASLLLANTISGTVPAKVMEARLGYSLGENQPKLAWIAMGLSNDNVFEGSMPGWWGASALESQTRNEGDVEGQEADATESIASSLKLFAEDPGYGLWFFAKKLGTEWLDPSFQSFYIADIGTMKPAAAERGTSSEDHSFDPWDRSFVHGYVTRFIFAYMDGYESVVLLAAAIGGVSLLKRARQKDNSALDYLLPCIFFMGFFVYILWEAKGMYCMPFFFCLIPLAARGVTDVATRATNSR